MATIRKPNGRWQAQIRKSGTRVISRTFTLRQDAVFWAREQERVLELKTDVLEKKTLLKKTLADLLHDYKVEVGQPVVDQIKQMGAKHEVMKGPLTDFMVAGDITLDQLTGKA